MGPFRQRTRLELAALVVLLATVASIVIVAFGLLSDDRATAADRVTAACRPLASAIAHDVPDGVTNRDVTRLRQETALVAEALRAVLKDTTGDVRAKVGVVRERLAFAADEFNAMPIKQRAIGLVQASRAAAELGARCPAPLTEAEGEVLDRKLARRGSR